MKSTFVARSIDIDVKHLGSIVEAAAKHKGISFIEVYQNCNIFNDHAFDSFAERTVRPDRVLYLEHGKPMIFGKESNKGIRMKARIPECVTIGENGITENDLLVHDIYLKDPSVAFMLARMEQPEFPQPVGIFRAVERATYEEMMEDQIDAAVAKSGPGSLEKLLIAATPGSLIETVTSFANDAKNREFSLRIFLCAPAPLSENFVLLCLVYRPLVRLFKPGEQ